MLEHYVSHGDNTKAFGIMSKGVSGLSANYEKRKKPMSLEQLKESTMSKLNVNRVTYKNTKLEE